MKNWNETDATAAQWPREVGSHGPWIMSIVDDVNGPHTRKDGRRYRFRLECAACGIERGPSSVCPKAFAPVR